MRSWSRQKSTNLIDQNKWSVVRNWGKTSEVNLVKPTLLIIADFLVYLFDEWKLSITVIKGYRSMLSSVYFSILPGITSSCLMKELIKGLEIRL